MYVLHNIGERSCNHCCCGKAISINTFWVCVCSLSYSACNAHALCYIVISGFSASSTFHIISQRARLKKKSYGS